MVQLAWELIPTLLLGAWLGWIRPTWADGFTPWMLRWGMPLSLAGLLLRAGLDPGLLWVAIGTALVCGLAVLGLQLMPGLERWLPQRTMRLGAVVGNTGYLGLPIALALLPPATLPVSISIDLVGTLITWGLGPGLLHTAAAGAPFRMLQLLWRSPAMRGVLLAVPIAITPWRPLLAAWLWWPARGMLWLLLVLIGTRLADLLRRLPDPDHPGDWRQPWPAMLFKLVIWPALVAALAMGLSLPWPTFAAVVLQAATPSAMSVLLLAEGVPEPQRQREVAAAARLVLLSTVLSAVTLPLWWGVIQAWRHPLPV